MGAEMTPGHALEEMMKIVWTIPRFWEDIHGGNESSESAFVRNRALHISLRAAMDLLDRVLEDSGGGAHGKGVLHHQHDGQPGDSEEVIQSQARFWLASIKDKFFEADWSSIKMGIGSPSDGITGWEVHPSSLDELKAVVGFANLIHTRLHTAGDYDLLKDAVEAL